MQTHNKYFEGRNPSQLTEFNQSYRGLFYAGLVVLLALLGGCGGGSDGTSTSTTSSTTTATGGGTSTGTSTSTSTSTSQPTTTTPTTSSASQPPATTNTSYKLIAKEVYDGVNALQYRTVYESNSDGNITKWQDYSSTGALRMQGTFYYGTSGSLLGKPIREEWDNYPFDGKIDSVITYSYVSDSKGNLTVTQKIQGGSLNGKSTVLMVTDVNGKVLSENGDPWLYNTTGKVASRGGNNDYSYTYAYNTSGQLSNILSSNISYFGVEYPAKATMSYSNSILSQINLSASGKLPAGQVDLGTATAYYRYNTKNQPIAVQVSATNSFNNTAKNLTYDTNGNVTQIDSSNGVITKYIWQTGKGYSGKGLLAQAIGSVLIHSGGDGCLSVVRPISPEEKLFTDMFSK